MDKVYQVFVSSTYKDLQDERREVIEALLGIGCLPSGMELFAAGDDDQWTLIRRVIDQCDYYIVISAGMYGTIHPATGKSYTQMEYEYAVSLGKPIIAFLYKDTKKLPVDKVEPEGDRAKSLQSFHELVRHKVVKFWDSRDSLAKAVYQSMINVIRDRPSPGWVRADHVHGETEMLLLKNTILTLEKELEPLKRAGVRGGVLAPHTEVDWGNLFRETKSLDLLFAYAETWRHGRTVELATLARTTGGCIRTILPDPASDQIVNELSRRFVCPREKVIEHIYDAAGHFCALKKLTACRADIKVYFYPFAPLYTSYRFDSLSVLSLYSHRGSRAGVITLLLQDGALRSYLMDEFELLVRSEKVREVRDGDIDGRFEEPYIEKP